MTQAAYSYDGGVTWQRITNHSSENAVVFEREDPCLMTIEEAAVRYGLGKPGSIGFAVFEKMFAAWDEAGIVMASYEPEISEDEAMAIRSRGFRNGHGCAGIPGVHCHCHHHNHQLGSPPLIEESLVKLQAKKKESK